MVQLILMVCLFIEGIRCNSNLGWPIEQKKIRISFAIDDSTINVTNNCTVRFINGNDTLTGVVDSIFLKIPDLSKDTLYDVSFTYKSYVLYFKNILRETIVPKQEIEWRFGIDNRPFDNVKGLLPYEEYLSDTITKQLVFFQFHPYEYGDGIQIVQKIK